MALEHSHAHAPHTHFEVRRNTIKYLRLILIRTHCTKHRQPSLQLNYKVSHKSMALDILLCQRVLTDLPRVHTPIMPLTRHKFIFHICQVASNPSIVILATARLCASTAAGRSHLCLSHLHCLVARLPYTPHLPLASSRSQRKQSHLQLACPLSKQVPRWACRQGCMVGLVHLPACTDLALPGASWCHRCIPWPKQCTECSLHTHQCVLARPGLAATTVTNMGQAAFLVPADRAELARPCTR